MEVCEAIISSLVNNVSDAQVPAVAAKLKQELEESVTRGSAITMLPNHHIEPLGKEEGEFVVVDVGGSTLRVSVVVLKGSSFQVVVNEAWPVRDDSKNMDSDFFRWVGGKISQVLSHSRDVVPVTSVVQLGLSWSFSLQQTDYNRGFILQAGKGFDIGEDVQGKDLNEILTKTMKNDYGIDINVDCIINDSLAVYVASKYLHANTALGCVLGTGLNMCVPLKTDLFPASKAISGTQLWSLFNSEVSLFGSSFIAPFVSPMLDPYIDDRFGIVGDGLHFELYMERDQDGRIFQPLELLTSGRYLQELARLSLVKMHSAGEILVNVPDILRLTSSLARFEGFPGTLVCFINENSDVDLIRRQLAQSFDWDAACITEKDATAIKTVVDAIIKRAAFIVAVVILAFIDLLLENGSLQQGEVLTMGYVGLVLQHYHRYRTLILQYLNDNRGQDEPRVEFAFIDNSTLVGTAVASAYFKDANTA